MSTPDVATQIRVLEQLLGSARDHAHRARSEDLDRETVRFWHGVCGWLRSRIRALEGGFEPDLPDAMRQAPGAPEEAP